MKFVSITLQLIHVLSTTGVVLGLPHLPVYICTQCEEILSLEMAKRYFDFFRVYKYGCNLPASFVRIDQSLCLTIYKEQYSLLPISWKYLASYIPKVHNKYFSNVGSTSLVYLDILPYQF